MSNRAKAESTTPASQSGQGEQPIGSDQPKVKPAGMTLEAFQYYTSLSIEEIQRLIRDNYISKPDRGIYRTDSVVGACKWYHDQITRPVTVDKMEMREITGLSDQRHRQLANEGYFPPPIKGRYELKPTCKGFARHMREMHLRRDKVLSVMREKKMHTEQALLDMSLAEKREQLISVDLMEGRLRPLMLTVRQKILRSGMSEDDKDELLIDLSALLKNAFAKPTHHSAPKASPDLVSSAAAKSQPVG